MDTHVYRTLWQGPMFAGKTTELIRMYNNYRIAKKKVVLFSPKEDTRTEADVTKTHSGQEIKAVPLADLQSALIYVRKNGITHVFIDEAQFVTFLPALCDALNNDHISVFMAGLNMDRDQEPFKPIQKIIHTCDVVQLYSVCQVCGSLQGSHSMLKESISLTESEEVNQTLIGGEDEYYALCRNCFVSGKRLQ